MTELFGRMAAGFSLDQARAELRSAYAEMKKDHPEAYPAGGQFSIDAKLMRDEITSGARTVLLLLLAAAGPACCFCIFAAKVMAPLVLSYPVPRTDDAITHRRTGTLSPCRDVNGM
jgi:putative ABC transport system permease protein